jgi:hypothetical protein
MLVTSASGANGDGYGTLLSFGPGGRLYCAGEDHVAAFDFATGHFAGPAVHLTRLNGQALVLIP